MDSLSAFGRGLASQGQPMMVFDWDKAARLIKERRPRTASAGLQEDWEWTGGRIYADGEPLTGDDHYTYLASTWARPELDMDGDIVDCYVTGHKTWDENTKWPESAFLILKSPSDMV